MIGPRVSLDCLVCVQTGSPGEDAQGLDFGDHNTPGTLDNDLQINDASVCVLTLCDDCLVENEDGAYAFGACAKGAAYGNAEKKRKQDTDPDAPEAMKKPKSPTIHKLRGSQQIFNGVGIHDAVVAKASKAQRAQGATRGVAYKDQAQGETQANASVAAAAVTQTGSSVAVEQWDVLPVLFGLGKMQDELEQNFSHLLKHVEVHAADRDDIDGDWYIVAGENETPISITRRVSALLRDMCIKAGIDPTAVHALPSQQLVDLNLSWYPGLSKATALPKSTRIFLGAGFGDSFLALSLEAKKRGEQMQTGIIATAAPATDSAPATEQQTSATPAAARAFGDKPSDLKLEAFKPASAASSSSFAAVAPTTSPTSGSSATTSTVASTPATPAFPAAASSSATAAWTRNVDGPESMTRAGAPQGVVCIWRDEAAVAFVRWGAPLSFMCVCVCVCVRARACACKMHVAMPHLVAVLTCSCVPRPHARVRACACTRLGNTEDQREQRGEG